MTNHAINLLLLAGSVLVIGGCNVGPDYVRPEAAMPSTWASAREGGATDGPAQVTAWWTTFGDPTLNALIERAVAGSYDLRAATSRLVEARAQRGVTASLLLPSVDATGGYDYRRLSGESGQGRAVEGDLFQAGFDATWEVDVWGRVRRSVEGADADISVAEENRRDVVVTLVAEVARNYVELREQQRRLSIAQNNAQIQQDAVDLAASRLQAGLGTDLDVARAQANLASTQSQIPVFQAGIRGAMYRLAVLVGREPGALVIELSPAQAIPGHPPTVPVGLPSDLLRRRADIRSAERAVAGASARIGVAVADLLPRFSLTGSFGFEGTTIGDTASSDARFFSVGPSVRWPIFEAGRIQSNIQAADARTQTAIAEYHQTVLQALSDVETALSNYARQQDRQAKLEAGVSASRRAVVLATELYSKGLSDFLSVIDAQRQLLQAEDELAQTNRQVSAELIALYKALGGGWESVYPEMVAAK